ncbi:MAG: hypothetical protein QOI41_3267, partial [Myxococcales bacterium]|nr:hypothetical protein [Myxococcales bacterium]
MKITGPRLALALPALSIGLLLASTACEKKPDATPVPATSASTTGVAVGDAQAAATARPAGVKLEKVTRADFNRAAAELALPLFWSADANKDGALDPDELAVYWGLV